MRRFPYLLALLGIGLSGTSARHPAPAAARTAPSATPGIVVVDGMTQPVFPLTDAIEERTPLPAELVRCHTRTDSVDSTLPSDSRLPLQISSPVDSRRSPRSGCVTSAGPLGGR